MFTNLKEIPTINEVFNKLESGATFRGCGYRERHYGTKDDADRVAKECEALGVACRDDRREDHKISDNYAALCVPGYSEIITLYEIIYDYDHGEKSVSISKFRDVLAIGAKVYNIISKNSKSPYSFSLVNSRSFEINWYSLERLFTEPDPNRVGKATAKKLAAWVEYLDRREAAAVAYLNKSEDAKTTFFARLDASGVKYHVSGKDIYITNGALSLRATVEQSGVYYSDLKIDARGEDALNFILNNKIEI